MDININLTELFTYLGTISTILFGYYTLIANRPRIFLKAVPIKNVEINKPINLNTNFNLSFINYGAKPAFEIKLIYTIGSIDDYVHNFIQPSGELDYDQKLSRMSLDENIRKEERDIYQAIFLSKVNSSSLEYENIKYIKSLFDSKINFLSGNTTESKHLGVTNSFSTGILKKETHYVTVTYKDLRDLNIPIYLFVSCIFMSIYTLFSFFNFSPLFYCFMHEISIRTGYYFNIKHKKYSRTFYDLLSFTVEEKNSAFSDNTISSYVDKINQSILKRNIFNETIYLTWEKNLTKDEFKIFKKYRLKYGDNIDKYIQLYHDRYSEFPKKVGLHNKLWNLIEIFENEKLIKDGMFTGHRLLKRFTES